MIKALGRTGSGFPFVVLGLTAADVAALQADQPIRFDLDELALPPVRLLIVAGDTEPEIVQWLADHGLFSEIQPNGSKLAPREDVTDPTNQPEGES